MMQISKTPVFIMTLVMVIGCFFARSEVVILKDGTRVEGVLISEDETSLLLEVQVTKGIKDEKRIPKEHVLKVEKSADDLKAFEEIAKLVPTPDGLSVEEYQQRIDQVLGFLSAYPQSRAASKTQPLLQKLRSEMKVVQEGGMKLNGTMHTADAYRANAFEMDASLKALEIRRLLASGNYLIGLRNFEDFEKEYSASKPYEEMIPAVIEAIGAYTDKINEMRNSYDQRVQQRDSGLKTMDEQAMQLSMKAIDAQKLELDNRFNSQRASRTPWVTPHPFHKPSLDYTLSQAKIELRRLEMRKTKAFVDGGAIYRDVMAMAIKGVDSKSADAAMRDVAKARMGKQYVEMLKTALDANLILNEKEK